MTVGGAVITSMDEVRMKFIKMILALGLGTLLQLMSGNAAADTVVRCDGCQWYQYHEKASSYPGYVYVVDIPNAQLTLWENRNYYSDPSEYDEISYGVEQLPVPPEVEQHYLYMLDKKIEAAESGKTNVVVHISPGSSNNWPMAGDPFGGFSNIDAFDVINSASVRTQLGANLARSHAAAQTSSEAMNNLLMTLNSVLMSITTPVSGQISFTIVITWKNGTQTTYTLDSSTANEAKYVQGASRTSEGNPIPDVSATVSPTGANYHGQYYFQTQSSLNDWVETARNLNITVSGSSTGSQRMSCTWVETTLTCKYL